jgi:hypothetical protein
MKALLTPQQAEHLGYAFAKEIPGHGMCGILRMIFTTGLFHGLDEIGHQGRWCYHTQAEAIQALVRWDGSGDPPGDWIKYKGKTEYLNPNSIQETEMKNLS